MSYKSKDRLRDGVLFKELMPFGGKLNEKNRWIVLHDQIPWKKLEEIYRKYHSPLGRPGKDSQLINGLLIVKHTMDISDEMVVEQFLENPYVQFFCGYDQLVTNEKEIDPSTLSKVRGRVGAEYFQKFENEIIKLLVEKKVIKAREQMVDATVYPAGIRYPTDTGLMEDVRQWLIKSIKELKRIGGIKEKIRTHCRKARAVYLKFQKKRKKTGKEIRKIKKQVLQYVRRNIKQVEELAGKVRPAEILDWAVKKGKWIKKKQRERNRIEGAIGNSKTTYGLEKLRYKITGGEEINIRLGLVAMNLTAMLARI